MKLNFFVIALLSVFFLTACSQKSGDAANGAKAQQVECAAAAGCQKADGCKQGTCDKASCAKADGCQKADGCKQGGACPAENK